MENEVKQNVEQQEETPEWEAKVKESMQNIYLKGMSVGGKTFVGLLYDIIVQDKKRRINPAITLSKIKTRCERLLDITESYLNKDSNNNGSENEEKNDENK